MAAQCSFDQPLDPGDGSGANGGTAFNGGNGSGGGGSSDVRSAPGGCAARTCDLSTRVLAGAGGTWTPVRYPESVLDPDTGELISDAEVAETGYTAFAGTRHEITARLVVRRVKDKNYAEALFPVWRYHAFLTNAPLSTPDTDLTHRQHAIIETAFADLIDGPLAHLPSGQFNANAAWAICAAITHNLLRAAGSLTSRFHARGRSATLRRHLISVPARLACPQGYPTLHLPTHWPWQDAWHGLHITITGPPPAA